MGEIHVHEFMSFDGVIDTPTWTAEYGFDPTLSLTACEHYDNGVVYLSYRPRG